MNFVKTKTEKNSSLKFQTLCAERRTCGQTGAGFRKFRVLILVVPLLSCTRDVLPPIEICKTIMPTYTSTVKPIIDQTCAYTGCHAGRGIAPGLYTTYNGLQVHIRSGSFVDRVINQKDNPTLGMPPDNSSYPESKQDDLTDEQLEIMQCWIQSGFPR